MQDQARQWQQDIGPYLQRAHQTVADLMSGHGAGSAPAQTAAGGGGGTQAYALAYKGGVEQPASAADIAAVPDVLPVALQPLLAQRLAANGLGINAAAQFARQMKIESGGSNIDAKTGDVGGARFVYAATGVPGISMTGAGEKTFRQWADSAATKGLGAATGSDNGYFTNNTFTQSRAATDHLYNQVRAGAMPVPADSG
jgi:hypothetical protein